MQADLITHKRKGYYVTLRDGNRTAWLAGPYETHREALNKVEPVYALALEIDPRAWFMARGTASIISDNLPIGRLNKLL